MTAPERTERPYAMVRTEPGATVPFVHGTKIGQILLADEARQQIAALIPHGVDFDHVLIEVHRATIKNPQILDCTPASIIMAVGQAVQTGLVIGKTIHLVPVSEKVGNGYEKRLQAWNDYKGDMDLVVWSGAARHVDAQCVYQNDRIEYRQGTDPDISHFPALTNRGPMIGAYAIAYLNVARTLKKIVFLSLDEIERVRKGSKQWSPEKARECPYWYAEKTAIHRLCKTLPKNPRLATVLAMMDARESADAVEPAKLLRQVEPLADAPSIAPVSASEPEAGEPIEQTTAADAGAEPTAEHDSEELDDAKALRLAGKDTSWQYPKGTPWGQKPIGACPTTVLKQARHFFKDLKQNDPKDWLDAQINAITLVLADREKEQGTLEFPNAVEEPQAPVDTRLAPGKVEDALDTRTPSAKPAPTLAGLSTMAAIHLKDKKFTPDERAQYKARFDKADTIEAMQALVTDLETFLKVEF
jgi:recombination protein RecT